MKSRVFRFETDDSVLWHSGNQIAMQNKQTQAALLFTKVPGLVPVKTRLRESSHLPDEALTQLAWCFLHDSLSLLIESQVDEIVIALEPLIDLKAFRDSLGNLRLEGDEQHSRLHAELSSTRIRFIPQPGENFANRLALAIHESSQGNTKDLVVIGSDAPLLSPKTIDRSLELAKKNICSICPSPRGGFSLLSLCISAQQSQFSLSQVFSHQERSELECCVEELRRTGNSVEFLPFYFDIDTQEDLETLSGLIEALRVGTENGSSQNYFFPSATAKFAISRKLCTTS